MYTLDAKYIEILKLMKQKLNTQNRDRIHHAKYNSKNFKFAQDIQEALNNENLNINNLNKDLLLEYLKKNKPEVFNHQKNNSFYYAKKIFILYEEKKINFYLITKYYNDLFLYFNECDNEKVPKRLNNNEKDIKNWINSIKKSENKNLELKEINIPIKELFNFPDYIHKNKILIDKENYDKLFLDF